MPPHFTTLDDLLGDPLIQKVMRADRVDPAALRREFVRVAAAPRSRLSFVGARFGCGPSARPLGFVPPAMSGETRLCGC